MRVNYITRCLRVCQTRESSTQETAHLDLSVGTALQPPPPFSPSSWPTVRPLFVGYFFFFSFLNSCFLCTYTHGHTPLHTCERHPLGTHVDTREPHPLGTHVDTRERHPLGTHVDTRERHPLGTHGDTRKRHPLSTHVDTRERHPLGTHVDTRERHPLGTHVDTRERHPLGTHVHIRMAWTSTTWWQRPVFGGRR